MYLTYLDESDTRAKTEQWKVVCAVVVHDHYFSSAELMSSMLIEDLMPEDQRKEFTEFHACELYGGFQSFEGIDQAKRFHAIETLLGLLKICQISVTYGAVDLEYLRQQPYGSANPLDMAFRLCVEQVSNWLDQKSGASVGEPFINKEGLREQVLTLGAPILAIFIADECDKADKAALQSSFRSMRKRLRPPMYDAGVLTYVHDDMYFGDSRYSIGIQMADLCAYFIARHLAGDIETERFYKMIEPHIFSSQQGQ